jgi:hypothetical protein
MSVPSPFVRPCRSILAAARAFWAERRGRAARKPVSVRLCLEGFEPRIVPTVTISEDPTTHIATVMNAADAGETVTLGTSGSSLTLTTTTNAPATTTPATVSILGNTATISDTLLSKVVMSTDPTRFLDVTSGDLTPATSLREIDYTGSNDTAGDAVDLTANLDANIFFKFNMLGAPTVADSFKAAPAGVNILQFSDQSVASTLTLDFTAASNAGNTKIALDFSALSAASGGATVDLTNTGTSLGQVYTNQTINFAVAGQATLITGLIGSPQADNFTGSGNGQDNYFVGNGGADSMTSSGGNDMFVAFQDFENNVTDLSQFTALMADSTKNTGTFGYFGYGKGTTDFNASFMAANAAAGPSGNPTVVMNGGFGNDSFYGFNGVSVSVLGNGGNDVYSTNTNGGFATVNMSADTSATIFGASGDTITGSMGNDTITMRSVANVMQITSITLGSGNNSVIGTMGPDNITSTSGNDTVFGNGGSDTITAGTGSYVFSSGPQGSGGVLFQTGNSTSTVNAFSGADTVTGNLNNVDIVGFPASEQNVRPTM